MLKVLQRTQSSLSLENLLARHGRLGPKVAELKGWDRKEEGALGKAESSAPRRLKPDGRLNRSTTRIHTAEAAGGGAG